MLLGLLKVNFQSSEKADLTIFASVLIVFMEELILRRPHSTIPEVKHKRSQFKSQLCDTWAGHLIFLSLLWQGNNMTFHFGFCANEIR